MHFLDVAGLVGHVVLVDVCRNTSNQSFDRRHYQIDIVYNSLLVCIRQKPVSHTRHFVLLVELHVTHEEWNLNDERNKAFAVVLMENTWIGHLTVLERSSTEC